MKTITKNMKFFTARALTALVMLTAPAMMLWAQEMNEKFSMTTQMFLDELKEQPTSTPRHTPVRRLPDGRVMPKARRLIASPDTVGDVAYISCFIHLKNVNDLSAVRALGVEVEETFDGLDFITARVPVSQLEPLADVDNVTKIKVAQLMRPMTDVARQKTNVDDLLKLSADATAAGISTKYDGTGVVLGIIDTGIDFQHIAFKDKDGNSRIKRAYVYNGSSAQEYSTISSTAPTTDDNSEDHGTHTATTAGGSSVIVNKKSSTNFTITVTDNHANATYGGMAPGADLYLAGINGLSDTYLSNALKKMVTYADAQGKPLVVSNSWGSGWGPRNGTGTWATLVGQYFGDSHPNHIILFASSNDAGHKTGSEGGGFFVKKSAASSSSPLGTIIRTDDDGGNYYGGLLACAWNASNSNKLYCKIHVLNNSTGAVLKSWTVTTNGTSSFSGLSTYYTGSMTVYIQKENGKYQLVVNSPEGLTSVSSGSYTLAIEVYPSSGSANINMWAGDYSYFTNHLTTSGHTWTAGTDDMCVSDEATIPNAISVGAYVSKKSWKAYNGSSYYSNVYTVGDIAYFSSYATAEQSPTGIAYPWITAPGARLAAGVNHYHTTSVDNYSYYGSQYNTDLIVNNSSSPYAMMEGTSMATPVAAGIVALWLQAAHSVNKTLTVNEVKTIMEQTAITDSYTNGTNASHFGKGKIDALAGIQYILQHYGGPTLIVEPDSLTFSVGVNEQKSLSFEVLGELLTSDVTVTLSDANNVFSIDKTSITKDESEDGATVNVTFLSSTAGSFTGTVTLSSDGVEPIAVRLKATANEPTQDGEALLYEGLSGYTGNELNNGINTDYQYLDYKYWAEFVKVYPGSYSNALSNGGRGGCLKLGSSSAIGSMKTGSISLTGDGTLTFYLKKYSSDTGKLNVTVTGATADVTQFTPTADWTLCTVNLTNATGNVSITLATSSKRAYIDEITLVGGSGGTTPVDPTMTYYQPADGKMGAALKTAMCGIVYNRTQKSYDDLWTAFQTTDVRSDGKIWDMYSNITNYTPVTSGSSYSKEGDCYNREHSFPQSWFGSNTPMNTDLHHIYPTDGFVNGKRANYPFGETNGNEYQSANGFSKLGTCTYPGYTGTVFEPADEYKGDFARTYFYMVTCYEEKLSDWYTNYSESRPTIDGSTYPALQSWQLNMLMEWAKNDPVSEKEVQRNNAVYAIQKNRNPFIDYPGLEQYVWGSMTTTAFSYDNYVQPIYKQDVTMAFNPTTATATLGEDFTEPTLTTTPANLTVAYSSSVPAVATVNTSTGEVTLVAVGTTTITATFAGNDTFNGGSASYTLTVSDASTPQPVTGSGCYTLVEDASTLKANDKIIIACVNETTLKALGTTQYTNNRQASDDVTLNSDGTLTPGEAVQVITLERDGDYFLFNVGGGYLAATGINANQLKTRTSIDDFARATISISGGTATITFRGDNEHQRNTIRYNPNNGSPIFSCYASDATVGSLPQIYRFVLSGDANGDSEVNIADVTAIINMINGVPPAGFNQSAADVNKDGTINIADVTAIINIINHTQQEE